MPDSLPPIYTPEQAGTALGPDGRKLVFFYIPQLEAEVRKLLGAHPREFTYRWAYHPGHQVHVLLAYWPLEPESVQIGVAIPEGPGDAILDMLQGESDIYITLEPLKDRLRDTMSGEEVTAITDGLTAGLVNVKFRRFKGNG